MHILQLGLGIVPGERTEWNERFKKQGTRPALVAALELFIDLLTDPVLVNLLI